MSLTATARWHDRPHTQRAAARRAGDSDLPAIHVDGPADHELANARRVVDYNQERLGLDDREAAELAAAIAQARHLGRFVPPIDVAAEDYRELRRFSRPIPAHKLRGLPACALPSDRSYDERTGTTAGYRAHRSADEPRCDACEHANSVAEQPDEMHRTDEACAAPSQWYPAGQTGTWAGIRAHKRRRQRLCEACAKYNYERNQRRLNNKSRVSRAKPKRVSTRTGRLPKGMACWEPTDQYPLGTRGTTAGTQQHQRRGEPACRACAAARNTRDRARRRSTKRRPARTYTILDGDAACEREGQRRNGPRTGTIAGYYAHRTAGEPACRACAAAQREHERGYYQRRQQAGRT